MRRPLAVIGFTMLFCGLMTTIFGSEILAVLLPLAVVGFVGSFFLRGKPNRMVKLAIQTCCTAALCITVIFMVLYAGVVQPLAEVKGTQKEMTVTVRSTEQLYGTASTYVVETNELLAHGHSKTKLHLQVSGDAVYQPGQMLHATWEIREIPQSHRVRRYGQGVFLQIKPAKESVVAQVGQKRTLSALVDDLRESVAGRIRTIPDTQASAMMAGVCLGDSSGLPSQVMEQFSRSGMSHIVAVSGLHTGMISGLLIGLFVMLRSSRRYVKLLSLFFVWSFVLMVGAPLSAIRAGVMYTFFAVGSLFYRQPDSLNTLGGAIIVILTIYPFSAGDLGFLASVFACLGIILLAEPLAGFLTRGMPFGLGNTRLGNALGNGMAVSASATVGTLPWCLVGFHTLSWVAPVANLLAVPLATIVLACGLFGAFLGMVPGFSVTGDLLLAIGGVSAKLLMAVARLFGGIPGGSRPMVTWVCGAAILVVLLTGVLMYCYRHKLQAWCKRGLALLLVVLLVASTWWPVYARNQYELFVIQNYGSTTLAICSKEGAVVIGAMQRQIP